MMLTTSRSLACSYVGWLGFVCLKDTADSAIFSVHPCVESVHCNCRSNVDHSSEAPVRMLSALGQSRPLSSVPGRNSWNEDNT